MAHLVLGTAGHIDHGKTALVRALTGVDTDRLAEERARGITIDLGFAHLPLGAGLDMAVVDVPGHEAFIRNMLAGVSGIDLVLLTVAADEGVMPQTREHLAIVQLLEVPAAVVAITKADLAEPAWLELVVDEVREALAGSALSAAPIVPVSARTGAGLDRLRSALGEVAARRRPPPEGEVFRMPVDRVFTVHGTGTVVTGTVWSGMLAADATVRILPEDIQARVRGLQAHGQAAQTVEAGQRAAVALVGIERGRLARGSVLVLDDGWRAHSMLTAHVRLLQDGSWSLSQRQRVRFHLGTAEVMARVALLDEDEIEPGGDGWAQLRLERPVVARARDRFILRSYSPVTTIGGGIVAEPFAPKRRRMGDAGGHLRALIGDGAEEAVRAACRLAGWRGLDTATLPIRVGHPPAVLETTLAALGASGFYGRGGLLLHPELRERARPTILEAAERAHAASPLKPGIDRHELRRALPPYVPEALVDELVDEMIADGALESSGGLVRLPGFEVVLEPAQREALELLTSRYREAGVAPPPLGELSRELPGPVDANALVRLLESRGELVLLAHPELYVDAGALARAEKLVQDRLAGRTGLSPADFKELLGVSRKHLIPLLEHLDRRGITVRRGDDRAVRSGRGNA